MQLRDSPDYVASNLRRATQVSITDNNVTRLLSWIEATQVTLARLHGSRKRHKRTGGHSTTHLVGELAHTRSAKLLHHPRVGGRVANETRHGHGRGGPSARRWMRESGDPGRSRASRGRTAGRGCRRWRVQRHPGTTVAGAGATEPNGGGGVKWDRAKKKTQKKSEVHKHGLTPESPNS